MEAIRRGERCLPLCVEGPEGMLEAARALAPGWAGVEEARRTEVQGGITNQLHLLEAEGCGPVLVRLYGAQTHRVIDREAENRLMAQLAARGFAPPYHGRFENGRVEGFLAGTRALRPEELAQHQSPIARRLAELHSMGRPPDQLWSTLERWTRAAEETGRAQAELRLIRAAVEELRKEAARRGGGAPFEVVLAHNDLLSGNVLLHEHSGEVTFIDYEYGAGAPAAFDMANHFCEYAGFDSDFARGFPSEAQRRAFIGHYLGDGASAAALDEWAAAVDFFVLVDHLWWASWAVVQSAHSPIAFDYLGYARARLAGLLWHADGPGQITDIPSLRITIRLLAPLRDEEGR
jgi:ethanolamine kinase